MGKPASPESVQRLVEDHYVALYRYAYRLSGSGSDAEDLTQEAFCKAQMCLSQLRDPGRVRPWLFSILRNAYLHRVRADRRQHCLPLEAAGDLAERPPEPLPEIDPERLQQALNDLPEAFRTPIILYYFEDFGYRDIAEQMDLPLGTVMSRLARAKAWLRTRLGEPPGSAERGVRNGERSALRTARKPARSSEGELMDCRTARLLLDFARRGPVEIDAAETTELEQHLAQCPECDRFDRAERRFDDSLGRAMRRVEVPPGLREQVLARLEAERGDWYRRRFGQVLRLAAAAAVVLVALWGSWRWLAGGRPAIDPVRVWEDASFRRPGRAEIEESFRRLDAPVVAPDLNYACLIAHGLTELPGYPGRVVPHLVFQHDGQNAVVFIIDTQRYTLPEQFEPPSGSPYQIERLEPADERFACLVFFTGENFAWLKNPAPPAT